MPALFLLMRTLHLFCRVIDNYGDIGVCWRLARQLHSQHACEVTLWVDDLSSFHRLCPELDIAAQQQQLQGICVRRWTDDFPALTPEEVADIVVEGFGCRLPERYLQAMAQRASPPVWLNLEYLSAEDWVEGCHLLPSPHPLLPLTKHFFFPGFTPQTGGLLSEPGLPQSRQDFLDDPTAVPDFLRTLGLSGADIERPDAVRVSLFCYPQAPLDALFAVWQNDARPVLCLVPEGIATAAVTRFLQAPAVAGARANRGGLTLQVIPFLDQDGYDRLLWSCDLNFVRGEDSMVRAQWAERPFLWHIYPQQEDAHLDKLAAFVRRYCETLPSPWRLALGHAMTGWNGRGIDEEDWQTVRAGLRSDADPALPPLFAHASEWAAQMRQNGDLAGKLIGFSDKT